MTYVVLVSSRASGLLQKGQGADSGRTTGCRSGSVRGCREDIGGAIVRSEAQSLTDYRFLRRRVCTAFLRGHNRDGRRRRRPSVADPKTLRTGATVADVDPESALQYSRTDPNGTLSLGGACGQPIASWFSSMGGTLPSREATFGVAASVDGAGPTDASADTCPVPNVLKGDGNGYKLR
jgi:hypothetical protein